MNIEIIDDIVNDIADKMGIYGACKSEDPDGCYNDDLCCCRVGFSMTMTERIYAAIENEKKLRSTELM